MCIRDRNYSEENLKQARAALERLYTALRGTDKTVAPAGGEAFEARFIEACLLYTSSCV